MSNILAAIGRAQLQVLDERVQRSRTIFHYYVQKLSQLPGIGFMPEPEWSRSNRWLTCILVEPDEFGATREDIRIHLEEHNVESRPVWKPMHLQPVFKSSRKGAKAQRKDGKKRYPCRVVGGEVAEDLFDRGLCLPSGTAMTNEDLDRVIDVVLKCGAHAKAQRR